MYNSQQYNTAQYNTGLSPTDVVLSLLQFNDYSFDTDNVRLKGLPNISDATGISLDTFNVANNHGGGVYGWHIRNKIIKVQALISANSSNELEVVLSSMKGSVLNSEKTLYYRRFDGKVLKTTASCTLFKTNREYYTLSFLPNIDIEFTTVDPFFLDNEQSQESFLAQSSDFSGTISYTQGEIRAEPSILINFLTGLSSVTTITATIGGKSITLEHNASDGDAIRFDSVSKDVIINGTGGNDYSGLFPVLEIGSNAFEIEIDGTREADIYFIWNGTYV